VHQFRMRPSSCFGDEPKTHPPLPKVFGFFQPLHYPKVFPSYLPTSTHFAFTPLSELRRA